MERTAARDAVVTPRQVSRRTWRAFAIWTVLFWGATGVFATLLALVWTQYQYLVFPIVFGYVGWRLLLQDLRVTGPQ